MMLNMSTSPSVAPDKTADPKQPHLQLGRMAKREHVLRCDWRLFGETMRQQCGRMRVLLVLVVGTGNYVEPL